MPKTVKWTATIAGIPLSFPSASSIVKGETCALSESEADLAVTAGLAVLVEPVKPAKAKE